MGFSPQQRRKSEGSPRKSSSSSSFSSSSSNLPPCCQGAGRERGRGGCLSLGLGRSVGVLPLRATILQCLRVKQIFGAPNKPQRREEHRGFVLSVFSALLASLWFIRRIPFGRRSAALRKNVVASECRAELQTVTAELRAPRVRPGGES